MIKLLEDEAIESCILMEEEIVLVIPQNHRLSDRIIIDLKKVVSESFISLAGYEEYKNTINKLCQAAGFEPKVVFEVDYDLLIEMFQLNKCATLRPSFAIIHKTIKIIYKYNQTM